MSEKQKREVPTWVVFVLGATIGLLWGVASDAWNLTIWHALVVAAPFYGWGLVSHLRDKRKERQS